MVSIALFCPAKVNLMLAVTGKREDGYHNLFSVVAPVQFGDTLWIHREKKSKPVSLSCSDPRLDTGSDNLVLKAVEVFRSRYPFSDGITLELEKRIPVGAGLGGGSSDAAGALLGLNQLLGCPLGEAELMDMALSIGSDCPFFLLRRPSIMEGRGELVRPLSGSVRGRLTGQRLLIFKPSFGVSTALAYGELAKAGSAFYCLPKTAREHFENWLDMGGSLSSLLYNNLEAIVFQKYLPLPVLKSQLEAQHPVRMLMSGSGSACFCPIDGEVQVDELKSEIREAWGDCAFIADVCLM